MSVDNINITCLICTLNEDRNIPFVLKNIPQFVDQILIVDGNSIDNTVNTIKNICPKANIILQEGKGKGDAIKTGLMHAEGDVIVTIDADCSMDPKEINVFIDAIIQGYEFVKGSRFLKTAGSEDNTFIRHIGNWGFAKLTNYLFNTQYTDVTYGFNAFTRNVIGKLNLQSDGFSIETEMCIKAKKANLRITEVPCYERKRYNGQAKLNTIRDGWIILSKILEERIVE